MRKVHVQKDAGTKTFTKTEHVSLPIVPMPETAEEAVALAKAEAAAANVEPASVMVTWSGGYVTGDGEVHSASGVTAGEKGKPAEIAATSGRKKGE